MTVTTSPEQQQAEQRSRIYWYLSDFYLRRPEPDYLGELRQQLEFLGDDDPRLARLKQTLPASAKAEEKLNQEFTRLFRGIQPGYGPPPPYESLYRGGQFMGEVTLAVQQCYQAAGYGIIEESAGPQDHIGAELRFLALLCHDEAQAWAENDMDEANRRRGQQRHFLDRHLGQWLPGYCQNIRQQSRQAFYVEAARLTEETLQQLSAH